MRILEAFWTRFGVTEDQLRQWPPQKVKDYLTVLRLEAKVNEENQRSGGGSSSGPMHNAASPSPSMSSSDMTEMAYRAMKTGDPSTDQPVGPHPNAAVRAERAKLFE